MTRKEQADEAKVSRADGSKIMVYGIVLLALLAAAVTTSCQSKKAAEPTKVEAVEPITLDDVKSVLGAANDYASGVVDFSQGIDEVIIAYRYYDADLQNYETDFASEMASRVQALYKKFRALDRIHFQVTANSPTTPNLWRPFTEFVLDRKTVEEIHWTGFLARYLLDLAIKNRKT
jgi:hypothetical protein